MNRLYFMNVFQRNTFTAIVFTFFFTQTLSAQRINYCERQWDAVNQNVYVSYANSNQHYDKYKVPDVKINTNWNTKAWKGEKVNTLILVWSGIDIHKITLQASDLIDKKGNKIDASKVKLSFVKYVWTDGYFGNGCNPRDSKMLDSTLVADMIDTVSNISLKSKSVQPIWVSFEVPDGIPASLYKGTITVDAGKKMKLYVDLQVSNHTLPSPEKWTFDLDIWQYPVSIATYHKVPLWSDSHFGWMKPYYEMLAKAGQKNITISMIEGGNQSKDVSPSMIKFIKKKDGTWQYDYTLFDKYVRFMMDCGIKKRIHCYSMVPWKLDFSYYDETIGRDTFFTTTPSTAAYKDYWLPMLKNFAAHLKAKNWFDMTSIAMDERKLSDMQTVIKIAKDADPEWKIALAGSYHEELMEDINDYSVFRSFTFTPSQLTYRNKHEMSSTFYTSCEGEKPNMFTFSPPAESVWIGWYAAAKGFTGYLRWAYNLWNENPLADSRGRFPAGDFFQIYPGPRSSVRFEKLLEGIQDYEKIKMIRKTTDNKNVQPLNEVMNSFEIETLDRTSAQETVERAQAVLRKY